MGTRISHCLTACGLAVTVLFVMALVVGAPPAQSNDATEKSTDKFSPYVAKDGAISRPTDYRERFLHLGTWAVAKKVNEPVVEMHNVYTRLEDIEGFRKNGKFPDGAILVKEITNVSADKLTTGQSTWSTDNKIWFVMIKDSKGRFPGNDLWGDGWGWALFKADEPARNVATDYTSDCKTCHVPAKQDDWIYVRGYPVLGKSAAAH